MIWKLLKEVNKYERLVRLAMPMREYIEKGEGVAISGDRNNIKITLSGDGADLEDVSWLMMEKNPKHGGIWELKNIRSTKSYGHFLVDIALEVIKKFGDKGLMIDRDKISDDGKRFWKSFDGGKLGTDWISLPEELSQYKGDEKYLDYYISGGNKGKLEKLISDGELYSEDFDLGHKHDKIEKKASDKHYILYHGSSFDFDFFKVPEKSSLRGIGIFFSDSIRYAEEFGNIIYKCQIELKNPKIYNDSLDFEINVMRNGGLDKLYNNLKENKHDGIIIKKSKVSTGRVLELIKFNTDGIKILNKIIF